jgi:hypothetical protein
MVITVIEKSPPPTLRRFKLVFDNRYAKTFGAVSASRAALAPPGAAAGAGIVGA